MGKLLTAGLTSLFVFFHSFPYAGTQEYATMPKGYYIVVGAFAPKKEAYAIAFADKLNKKGYHAQYGLDYKRNLLLVYLDEYAEFDVSIREMLATRQKGEFPEAWVRIIKEGPDRSSSGSAENTDTVTSTQVEKTPIEQLPVEKKPEEQKPVDSAVVVSPPVEVVIPEKKKDKPVRTGPATLTNTSTIFNIYDPQNSIVLDAQVEVVDTDRARLLKTFDSNDTITMPNPNNDSGTLSLVCNVFGYRKVQHEISYKDPLADTAKHYLDLEGDYFVVHFEMVRLRRGDIETLYNVYFYNDAAIMMPESKYELERLLDMMSSNPKYRIILHGHTNGNSHGTILSMGPSKSFFSVNAPDIKKGKGSSKELSFQRAQVIKDWLVAKGIAADRMDIRAWGGKRMLHDRNSVHAKKNVRVEVEVLAD